MSQEQLEEPPGSKNKKVMVPLLDTGNLHGGGGSQEGQTPKQLLKNMTGIMHGEHGDDDDDDSYQRQHDSDQEGDDNAQLNEGDIGGQNMEFEQGLKPKQKSIQAVKSLILSDLKTRLKEKVKNQKPRSKDYLSMDHHTYHDHCVFEPQNFFQKIMMIRMNGLEVLVTILVGAAAIWRPSIISGFMYFMTGNLFIAAKKFAPKRMHYRQVIASIIFGFLFLEMIQKVYTFATGGSMDLKAKHASVEKIESNVRWVKSLGFYCKVVKTKETEQDYPNGIIEIQVFNSLVFEIISILAISVFYYYSRRTQANMKYLDENKEAAHQLRLDEAKDKQRKQKLIDEKNKKEIEDDESEAELNGQTHESGQQKMGRSSKVMKRQKTMDKQNAEHNMLVEEQKKSNKYRNYIECETFKTSHHTFFINVVISNLLNAVVFNSLIDLSILFLFLVVISLQAYKEDFKKPFLKLLFFTVYWCQIITQLKIYFVIMMMIPEVTYRIQMNEKNIWIKVLQTFFGLDFIVRDNKSGWDQFMKIFYYANLFISLLATQLWKQSRWGSIRDVWIEEHNHHKSAEKMKRELVNDNKETNSDCHEDKWGSDFIMLNYYLIMHTFHSKIQITKKANQEADEVWKKIQLHQSQLGDEEKENYKKLSDEQKQKNVDQLRSKYQLNEKKQNSLSYLPGTILWVTRFLVTFQSYMYCQHCSLYQLIWVILTFMISNQLSLFISILFMIPFYLLSFLVIYVKRIKNFDIGIKEFCTLNEFYNFNLEMPVLEQMLFFLILTCFFLMISALKPSLEAEQEEDSSNTYFIALYKQKLTSKHSSILWKYSFYLLRHIQKFVFLFLFITGTVNINQLDTLSNLGFIFLFALYFTFEDIYRSTTMVPLIFISSFVLTRYYYGQEYHIMQTSKHVNLWAKWFGMWSNQQKPDWEIGSSLYFRQSFQLETWGFLIVFKTLNVINQLFKDRAEVASLETKVYQAMRFNNEKGMDRWNNIKQLIGNQLIYIYVVVMIFFLSSAQVSFITFVMYAQNIFLIASVCRQDKSMENIKKQLGITTRMKIIAALAIVLDTVFMALVGVHTENTESGFAKNNPWLYQNLSFIGLRVSDNSDKLDHKEKLGLIKDKLYFQAQYLIMSILIHDYFKAQEMGTKCAESWTGKDFQKLYEYSDIGLKKKQKKEKIKSEKHDLDDEEISELELREANKQIAIETFKKKKTYTKWDIQDRYNFRRWQTQFIVYEIIDWWPLMDYIASLSHIFNGFLIIYIALYYNVSFFMFVYVSSVAQYYIKSISKIEKMAKKTADLMTLGSQIDIEMASNICKFYNSRSSSEFQEIRTIIWNFQLNLLVCAAVLSFPTQFVKQLIDKLQHMQEVNPFDNHDALIKHLDKATYWLYFAGIYTGNDAKEQGYYNNSIGILFAGLFLEKAAINWLKNRWGCTYFNFQKFVELEVRQSAIKENWGVLPIPYKPEHYRYHNFYKPVNFDVIVDRLFEDPNPVCKKHLKLNGEFDINSGKKLEQTDLMKNFIPYKEAIRLKTAIEFSLRVNGRDPSLKLGGFDKKTNNKITDLFDHIDKDVKLNEYQKVQIHNKNKLKLMKQSNEIDDEDNIAELEKQIKKDEDRITQQKKIVEDLEEIDIVEKYEEIDILKTYKIESLEKIIKNAINMKYKISFSKGMIFFFEALVIATLLVSIALKSNIFSLIYLIFVFRYPFCESKHQIYARLCFYISISLSLQYLLYWLNITELTAVQALPKQFKGFPFKQMAKNKNYLSDEGFPFPIIFQLSGLIGKEHFLKIAYFLGIGIDSSQLENLMLDFFNLYLVSMYILYFRNPIFDKSMKKVFWKFPLPTDDPQQWNRVDEDVKKQILWRIEPISLDDKKYETLRKERKFSKKYQEDQKLKIMDVNALKDYYYDFNTILINYVDLKYQQIWSNKFVKKVKNQLKDQIFYFRLVKQGSQVIYLGFHILTIFVIILLSIMRQSLVSLIYLIVICIKIMYNVEDALKERSQNLHQEIEDLELEISEHHNKLKELEEKNLQEPSLELEEQILKLKQNLEAQNQELMHDKFNYLQAKTNKGDNKMKNKTGTEIKQKKEIKSNTLPFNFKWTLQILVILDFSTQIMCQMPFVSYGPGFSKFGFRKIWYSGKGNSDEAFNYADFVNPDGKYQGLKLIQLPLVLQILNCIMIVFVFTQVSIFNSPGYIKYVTQKDGSMNLLLQLSVLKGKSVAYRFNNFKILKVIGIQKKKELVLTNFEELKSRMKNWRVLKKQTIDIGIQGIINQKQKVGDNLDKQVEEKMGMDYMGDAMGTPQKYWPDLFKKMKMNTKNKVLPNQTQESIGEEDSLSNSSCEGEAQEVFQDFDDIQEHPTMSEKQAFLRRASLKLVEEKLKHINILVDIYQFVQKNWIEQIFFKNEREEVELLVLEHSRGSVEIPTELERIMDDEAYEFISNHFQYANQGTQNDLNNIVIKFKNLEAASSENIDHQLLDIIKSKLPEETTLKLKEMTRTWEFTRPGTMIIRLIETFFYFFVSKIQYIIYMMMIYSTYENAGLITIIYPFMIFGWALLEETRPNKTFWQVLKFWTTVVLFFKFFCNIKWNEEKDVTVVTVIGNSAIVKSLLTKMIDDDFLKKISHSVSSKSTGDFWGYLKLGLFSYNSIADIVIYILPEIFILCLLMINSIYLRMLGFRNQSEHDIEDVNMGIHRAIERGDIEQVHEQQRLDCFMNLKEQFPSAKDEKKRIQKELDDEIAQENFQNKVNIKKKEKIQSTKNMCLDRTKEQEDAIKSISQNIKNATFFFKLDTNQEENQLIDRYIRNKQLKKIMDDDVLIFREGGREQTNLDFIGQKESDQDYLNHIDHEIMSGGDNDVDFNLKSDVIILRNKPEMGIFESSRYFNRLFPALKIQKPGYDLYGSTNIFLTIVVIFVFAFFDQFNVAESKVIPGKIGESNMFSNGMIMLVLFVILCMLLERFANRTATKAPMVNQGLQVEEGQGIETNKYYFNSESLIVSDDNLNGQKTGKYNRWTKGMGSKSDKNKMIKLSDQTSLNYLADLQEENKVNRTKISTQQKVKYFMHMTLLFLVHFYIFWFVPITGNISLYGSPNCNEEKQKYYGCKDFHRNPYLKVFYLVLCIYLFLSAMQIKFGLPIMKMPSSVLQYNDNLFAYSMANVYQALPFIVEIRCLIDFSFANTSLDIFQFWELYQANFDMYNGKNGNIYYFQKVIGEPMPMLDRCLMGFLFSAIVLAILCGPLILFSPMAGFIAPNPVTNMKIDINFLITEQISDKQMKQYVSGNMNALQEQNTLNLDSIQKATTKKPDVEDKVCKKLLGSKHCTTDWYNLYNQINPQLRTLNETLMDESKFKTWTESRFFTPDQIQLCLLSEYPDKRWQTDKSRLNVMKKHIVKALDENDDQYTLNLGINMIFDRHYPPGSAKHADRDQLKSLNTSLLHDCQTKKQLIEYATKFDCAKEKKDARFEITYYEAFSPYIILGASKKAELLSRKPLLKLEKEDVKEMMHDMKLTYVCASDEWEVLSSVNSTHQTLARNKEMLVDPDTCEYLDKDLTKEQTDRINQKIIFSRVTVLLFSMLVSSSFLASYSLTSFYIGVVYLLGSTIRVMLIWPSYKSFMYEAVETDSVLQLIDYVYNRRYEEDLVGEEEGYRMVREILMTPEFFKSICGSCLRGTLDPQKDFLSEDDEKNIRKIEQLEKKGFEVKKLKEKILENAQYKHRQQLSAPDEDNDDDNFQKQ